MASGFGNPGKNDFRLENEAGESSREYTGTQSSRKQKANDSGKKPPSLADQMAHIERQY